MWVWPYALDYNPGGRNFPYNAPVTFERMDRKKSSG